MIRTLLTAVPRFALFLLALIPVLIGSLILHSMYQGGLDAFTEPVDVIRRSSYPVAIIGHIIGGSTMLILGFTQFSTRLRRAYPGLHRWVGRGLVLAGIYFALSGLVMNAAVKAQADSPLYDGAQNLMAVVFLAVLFLGIRAIRFGNVARHRVWMMRAYAITLGAATQTLMLLPVFLVFGPPEGLVADLAFISGWVVNLAVAEVVIRRKPRPYRPAPWNGSANTAPNRS